MSATPNLLVTGASGNLGRRTLEFLLATAAGRIIAGSRDTSKLADLVARGAEARTVDFDRPETLAKAFGKVDRLLLISTDSLAVPGQRIAQHKAAIRAAVTAGVKHIIYTSVTNPKPDPAMAVMNDHYETEQAIIASGLGYTFLRNTLYLDNLLGALPQILSSGQWFHAAGSGKIALVSREDCARIAAGALDSDFAGNRILDVTGPELLTPDETASIISEVSGKPVSAIAIDAPSLIAGLTGAGVPEPIAKLLAAFDTAQARGEFAVQSSAIRDLTGREPQSIRGFLAAHV